jgi:hypothetical protein
MDQMSGRSAPATSAAAASSSSSSSSNNNNNSILYYLCAEPTATRPLQSQQSADIHNYIIDRHNRVIDKLQWHIILETNKQGS